MCEEKQQIQLLCEKKNWYPEQSDKYGVFRITKNCSLRVCGLLKPAKFKELSTAKFTTMSSEEVEINTAFHVFI